MDRDLPALEELPTRSLTLDALAPAALVAAGTDLWVQSHRGTTLTRVDTRTGKVTAQAEVGRLGCGDLGVGAGAVWLSGCAVEPGQVAVDLASGKVRGTLEAGGLGSVVVADRVWAGAAPVVANALTVAASADLAGPATIPVPGLRYPEGVVAVAGDVWVLDKANAVVYRVDPDRQEVVAAVPLPVRPDAGYLVRHDGAPWYVDPVPGVLIGVDPRGNVPIRLSVRFRQPHDYWGIAASSAGGGRMWVRSGDDEAWLVDTRRDRVVRRIALPYGGGGDVQQVGDQLWVASFSINELERIELD